jgi:protein TonB
VRTRTVILSLLFHAGLAASLLGVAAGRAAHHPIAVALAETAKKKDKPKPKPLKPPPRQVARPPVEHKVAAVSKALAAPVIAAPRIAVATAVAMSNDDGPGGIALPSKAAATGPAPARVASAVTESRRQRMREAVGPGSNEEAPCSEEATRPEPVFKQEIEYTAQARAEGVEGKLKLRLTIGADGAVVRVDVIESVSAELDAAAVAAAKQWRFKPAMACGRPIAGGTYVLARRFELGD